jgi:hypothetical protein
MSIVRSGATSSARASEDPGGGGRSCQRLPWSSVMQASSQLVIDRAVAPFRARRRAPQPLVPCAQTFTESVVVAVGRDGAGQRRRSGWAAVHDGSQIPQAAVKRLPDVRSRSDREHLVVLRVVVAAVMGDPQHFLQPQFGPNLSRARVAFRKAGYPIAIAGGRGRIVE